MSDLMEAQGYADHLRETDQLQVYEIVQGLINEIERLQAELSKFQESSFNPDWSKLEATRALLQEHKDLIKKQNESRNRMMRQRDAAMKLVKSMQGYANISKEIQRIKEMK